MTRNRTRAAATGTARTAGAATIAGTTPQKKTPLLLLLLLLLSLLLLLPLFKINVRVVRKLSLLSKSLRNIS